VEQNALASTHSTARHAASAPALLTVDDLSVTFRSAAGEPVPAVRGVSLEVGTGEIVGLVGESGSGKSVTCMALLRLLPAGTLVEGHVRFGGEDVIAMSGDELRSLRATRARMIFQDPASSLNPLMRVGHQVTESIRASRQVGRAEAERDAVEMLERVGIAEPRRRFSSYPHEMSGGMLQRVMIAMALAASPQLLICDEPTTALDVTTEAQILELLRDLNAEYHTSIIFTTHDLGLVRELCDRVLVMYGGRIAEAAATQDCLGEPWHPYTAMLLGAEPESAPPDARRLKVIEGTPPRPTDRIPGCTFHPRCPLSEQRCAEDEPPLMPVPGRPDHRSACWVTIDRGPANV
jgi:oligopeptide/dipeptide ABC transporter ATP-binding protein